MSNIGIALDLAAIRKAAARGLPAALARVREAGFDFVQWRGLPAMTAADVQAALDAAGLTAIAGGMDFDDLAGNPEEAIAYWSELRIPDLSVGGLSAFAYQGAAAWRDAVAKLDTLAQQFQGAGIRLAYHPAPADCEVPVEGSASRLDILIDAAGAQLCIEIDTSAIHQGGADVARYIRRCPARCPLLHLHETAVDGRADQAIPLGGGILDWEQLFDAGEEAGAEWYVCTQVPAPDPFADLAASYAFLAQRA